MTLLQVQPLLDTWQPASWEEFVCLADDPKSDKLKCYYFNGQMRFEPKSTGVDHSSDHCLISFAVSLFIVYQKIVATGLHTCSYRRLGFYEFQPDISYHIGENVDLIHRCTGVVNLEQYTQPDLVIEISDTSLSDDLGIKRLQYEELRISEYWIVNVQAMKIVAFTIAPDGATQRIQESRVLPGLRLEILEQALVRSRQETQSATNAWVMQQFQR